MGAKYIARKARERGGPIVGGPEWDIKLWNEQGMASTRAVYLDSALSIALAQPLRANAGWQYLTTAQVLPADTFIDLEATSDIRVGDVFQLVDGAFVAVLTVKTVVSATRIEVLAAAGGAHTYAIGATAGDPDNLGDIAFWVDDGLADPWISITKVGSAIPSIPRQFHTKVSAMAWQDEGVDVASRSKLNVVGNGIALTDDAGNSRVVVTHADLGTHGGTITDAQHGARSVANAHQYGQIGGTHGTSAHDSTIPTSDDVIKWALIG